MTTQRNVRRAEQELRLLGVALPRLERDEAEALAAFLEADSALDLLDLSSYGGFAARRVEAAQTAVRAAQEWHRRARRALERAKNRQTKLRLLLLGQSGAYKVGGSAAPGACGGN